MTPTTPTTPTTPPWRTSWTCSGGTARPRRYQCGGAAGTAPPSVTWRGPGDRRGHGHGRRSRVLVRGALRRWVDGDPAVGPGPRARDGRPRGDPPRLHPDRAAQAGRPA